MENNIIIRAYKTTDKSEIIDLLKLNTPEYFSLEEEKDLIHYLDHEIEQYYVVEYDKKVVGSGGINFSEDQKMGRISWDILDPAYQGKGIGNQLLKHRVEKLKTFDTVEKISVRTSQLAYKFYEKFGFKLIEVQKDYWAKGFDLYRMEL